MKLAQTNLSKLRRSDLFVENRSVQDSKLRGSGIFGRRADVAPAELENRYSAVATKIPRPQRCGLKLDFGSFRLGQTVSPVGNLESQVVKLASQLDKLASQVGYMASQLENKASQMVGRPSQVVGRASQAADRPSQVSGTVSQVPGTPSQTGKWPSQAGGWSWDNGLDKNFPTARAAGVN